MSGPSPLVVAFRVVPRLPLGLVLGLTDLAADATWALRGRSVRLMERNHARVLGRPLTRAESRAGVRSHFRAYAEQLACSGMRPEQIDARVRFDRLGELRARAQEGPVVLALTHSGNYDLAAAYAGRRDLPVLTVAERLDPPELFQAFVDFRESLGMEILAAEKGRHIFGKLVERAARSHALVPLLADRDITGSGIEVDLCGHRALVAAGPAALAERLGRPLFAGVIHYERLPRERGRGWGVVVDILGPVSPPGPDEERTGVEAHTQAWVDAIAPLLRAHVRDWHMMQRLFVDDLDPGRLARARERHRSEEDGA
jgi:KDO2-lipid IV(A) lauroyltransferase